MESLLLLNNTQKSLHVWPFVWYSLVPVTIKILFLSHIVLFIIKTCTKGSKAFCSLTLTLHQNAAPHSKHRGVSVVHGLDWFSCGAFLLRAVKVKSLITSVVLLYVFGQMLLKTGFCHSKRMDRFLLVNPGLTIFQNNHLCAGVTLSTSAWQLSKSIQSCYYCRARLLACSSFTQWGL